MSIKITLTNGDVRAACVAYVEQMGYKITGEPTLSFERKGEGTVIFSADVEKAKPAQKSGVGEDPWDGNSK